MLKPIKTFFNYLQKNANTSNIFRLSNDLSMSDEMGTSSAMENGVENGVYDDDPLTDPLAIEIDDSVVNTDSNIVTETVSCENNSIDDFIFVDIEKLKNKINNGSKIEQKHKHKNNNNNSKKQHFQKSTHESDINGNNKHSSDSKIVQKSKKLINKNESNTLDPSSSEQIIINNNCSDNVQNNENDEEDEEEEEFIACETSECAESDHEKLKLLEKNTSISDKQNQVIVDKDNLVANQLQTTTINNNNNNNDDKNVNSNFVISVTNSEPEIDENDTSVLLEEIRSDGSDSGLGLDTLKNISIIEKSLATLTPSKSSLKRRSSDAITAEEQPKKSKQGINFGNVTVFYFPRCQGFNCVPTQGGSTLGMTTKHAYKKSFTLNEHAIEQRRINRLKLAGNELNPSSSSSDESKSDDEISENSLSEADTEAYGFLQPLTARQRRAVLKAAGVRKIDTNEKDDCRQLRISREVCGCTCRGYCDPDTCECSLAGIKCQVDRLKPHEFPCGCNRDGCANVNGRIEFNPARVKTHFIHTIMRLELEKRHELSDVVDSSTTSVIQQHQSTKWWSQMRLSPSSSSPSTSQTAMPSNSTNNGYGAYIYGNSQYPTSNKIPPISTMVSSVISQESLDLHYAYRDDYANTLTLSAETNGSSFNNSNDYYSNFNYMTSSTGASSSNLYHNSYHQSQALSHLASYQTQSNYINDCQFTNYSPTNSNNSGAYHHHHHHHQHHTPRIETISSDVAHVYMNNYATTSMHNGANRLSSYQSNTHSPQQQHQQNLEILTTPNDNNNYCSITTSQSSLANNSTDATSPSSSASTVVSNNHELENGSNEHLSEIIKKSIVESVTA